MNGNTVIDKEDFENTYLTYCRIMASAFMSLNAVHNTLKYVMNDSYNLVSDMSETYGGSKYRALFLERAQTMIDVLCGSVSDIAVESSEFVNFNDRISGENLKAEKETKKC